MPAKRKLPKKQLEVAIILLIAIVSIFLWNTFAIYPVKLLVVLLHELSHGIAAVVSGGYIEAININERLGGHCMVVGGNDILISSAGYLGSLVWGALMFISAYNHKINLWFSTTLGFILIFVTANYFSATFPILVTLAYAAYFLLAPQKIPPVIHAYISKTLGLVSCLYVVVDISQDVVINTYIGSDAMVLSTLTNIPSTVWGAVWLICSAMTIYYLLKYSYRQGLTEK